MTADEAKQKAIEGYTADEIATLKERIQMLKDAGIDFDTLPEWERDTLQDAKAVIAEYDALADKAEDDYLRSIGAL